MVLTGLLADFTKEEKVKIKPSFLTEYEFSRIFVYAFKAPRLVPEKFEILLATAYGLGRLLFLGGYLLFDPSLHSLANAYQMIVLLSSFVYAMMRTTVFSLDRWALLHAAILFLLARWLPQLAANAGWLRGWLSELPTNQLQTYFALTIYLIYPLARKWIGINFRMFRFERNS